MGMKEEFAHLADWVDVEEKRKETLKNGLLAFLKTSVVFSTQVFLWQK